MRELEKFSRDIKQRYKRYKIHQPKVWSDTEHFRGEKTQTLTIILQTRGCRWAKQSGCSMCGYFTDSHPKGVTKDKILAQLDYALTQYHDEPVIKIYTSGSFLDPLEIPLDTQKNIFVKLSELSALQKVTIESRPEFVTPDIEERSTVVKPKTLEIAIGLESANDGILTESINKGFLFNDWLKAAEYIRNCNLELKTYLLIKPPLITEKEAKDDGLSSVEKIHELSTCISFNPMNIQKYTVVEWLWDHGEYRPPWLWTIVDILKETKKQYEDIQLQCGITGGGKKRGAHNCYRCDSTVLAAIQQFTLTQNISHLTGLDKNHCECKKRWKGIIELEGLTKGYTL